MHRMKMGKKTFTAVCNRAVLGVVIAIFAAGYVEQSFAASGDTLTDDVAHVVPYVADQETYDSNLYCFGLK